MQEEKLTIEECRAILGDSGTALSDEQILRTRDDLERVASTFYDEIAKRSQTSDGVEAIHWAAYIHTCSKEELRELIEGE